MVIFKFVNEFVAENKDINKVLVISPVYHFVNRVSGLKLMPKGFKTYARFLR